MAHLVGTQTNFQTEVLDYQGKVLVDFWAPWCGPCQMLSPVIDEISEQYSDKLKVVKINVDEEPGIPSQFNITSIPTVLIFEHGQVVDSIVGFHQKEEYLSSLGL